MYWDRDFNESTGERTIRQTDQQKLWLFLAAFRSQTTKYSLFKKNKFLKLKKIAKFLNTWANFLGDHTDSTVWKYVWLQHYDNIFTWFHQFIFNNTV